MPIYAYRCSNCGHAEDVLQKMSDSPLTQCPACGEATYVKQVTAAGFQLKGSGWYVTDFRDGGKKPSTANQSADNKPSADTAKTTNAGSASGSADGASSAPAVPSSTAAADQTKTTTTAT